MKTVARDEEGNRVYFDIFGDPNAATIDLTTPDGKRYFLLRSQVEIALGVTALEKIIKAIEGLSK